VPLNGNDVESLSKHEGSEQLLSVEQGKSDKFCHFVWVACGEGANLLEELMLPEQSSRESLRSNINIEAAEKV
jgi:hypothetical protein